MALKADRHEFQTDISFFSSDDVQTRGGCVVHGGVGSGAAMDQGAALVLYKNAVTATDVPVGILLNDIVNKDLTRTHLNHHKDEVQLGGKVTILRKGWVVTNSVSVADGAIVGGDLAFVGHNGLIVGTLPTAAATKQGSGNLCIGRFMSGADADSYYKVEVNLPNHGGSHDSVG
jgi:hypothetical protein|tara:strand:- start:1146 stop:1667 length:522 start_codon:yes stop_codon:yes gene_type:complete